MEDGRILELAVDMSIKNFSAAQVAAPERLTASAPPAPALPRGPIR